MRQNSSTSNPIFDVYSLISFISTIMTLDAGDVIAAGTPAGLGYFQKPHPRLLQVGDVIEVEIERIGTLVNTVSKDVTDKRGLDHFKEAYVPLGLALYWL